jgi:hypothetical protein
MEAINDDDIIGLVKGKIGEVMHRIDRERPELSKKDREAIMVRIGQQEVALALVSRPDLAKRLGDIATEHFLHAIVSEVRSVRSA